MSIWLRVGGYPATEIAAHTPPTWETWADGGCGSASWAFSLSTTSQHQALRANESLVEILCGPMPVWSGLLGDYDRTTGECSAYGLSATGQKFLALDAGANTRDLGLAIAGAIGRGWRVINPAPVTGPVAGDATGNPISVAQLLTEYAEQTGQRWGVDAARRVFMRPDPTAPTWLASPDAAAFGTTSEDRATRLFGRYLDSTTSLYATAVVGDPGSETSVDLSDRGEMTLAAAEAILTGMLQRELSGPAWTNGATLTSDQIQTRGGTPAFLASVQAGQTMRSLGMSNAVQPLALDTVIGKTRYTAGEDVIYVEPTNTAPRTLTDVIAAA